VTIPIQGAEHLQGLLDGLALHHAAPDAAKLIDFFEIPDWSDSVIADQSGDTLASVISLRERIATGENTFSHQRQILIRPDGSSPGYAVMLDSAVSQNERKPISLIINWGDTALPTSTGGRLQRWHQFAEVLLAATESYVEETPFFEASDTPDLLTAAEGAITLQLNTLDNGDYQLDGDTLPSTQPWMLSVTSPYSLTTYSERVEELFLRLDYPFARDVEFVVTSEGELGVASQVAMESLKDDPTRVAAVIEVDDVLLVVTRSSTEESIRKEYNLLVSQERYDGSQFMSRFDWTPSALDLDECSLEDLARLITLAVPTLSEDISGDVLDLVEGRNGLRVDLGLEYFAHSSPIEFRRETLLRDGGGVPHSINGELIVGTGAEEVQLFLAHAPGNGGFDGNTGVQISWPQLTGELTVAAALERWKLVDQMAEALTGFPVPQSLSVLEVDEFEPGRMILGERMGLTLEGH
jgi:hypothetical protein